MTYDVTFVKGIIETVYDPRARPSLREVAPITRMLGEDGKKRWLTPSADADAVVKWADSLGKKVDPVVREYAGTVWMRELDAMAVATATSLPAGSAIPVTGLKSTLLPTQEVVVLASSRAWVQMPGQKSTHRALLIADEPGLGKSIESLAALRVTGMECARTVVVCPTSLTKNWEAEIEQHFEPGTFTPWFATGKTASAVPKDVDTVIVGWEILADWDESLRAWKPDAIVADEGHYGKSGKQMTRKDSVIVTDDEGKPVRDEHGNVQLAEVEKKVGGSARATSVIKIGEQVARAGGLVLGLTGTPMVNRPVELAPLIEFHGLLPLFAGTVAYKERFCDPQQKKINGRMVTQYSGSSNLLELNARLTGSGHYIRRTKEVLVQAGLMLPKYVDGAYVYDRAAPPKPWVINATDEEMEAYFAVMGEAEEFFATRAQEIATEIRAASITQRVQEKVKAEGHKHLQQIMALRKAAAIVKMPYIIRWVRKLSDRGEKVVIAAHHREVVDGYADAFSGLKIQGGMGVKKIEEAKHLFNSRPVDEHPVLVLSVEAGKTGHTLCKQEAHGVGPSCAIMVFGEQVWTPGDETQTQDRIWRIGQSREVRIANALLRDSVDLKMFGQRLDKRRVVNAAIDAVPEDAVDANAAERAGAGLLAWDLAARGLARRQPSPTR